MSSVPEESVPAFCEGARRLGQGLANNLAAEGLGFDVVLCLLRLVDRRTRPEVSEVFSCRLTKIHGVMTVMKPNVRLIDMAGTGFSRDDP